MAFNTPVIPTAEFVNPSFTVLDKNGVLLPSIKHCFIEHMLIPIANPPVTLRAKNGISYQAVYDSIRLPETGEYIKAIVSFQQHTYGNFAVIRNRIVPTSQTKNDNTKAATPD